jgi:hypothetical protein
MHSTLLPQTVQILRPIFLPQLFIRLLRIYDPELFLGVVVTRVERFEAAKAVDCCLETSVEGSE